MTDRLIDLRAAIFLVVLLLFLGGGLWAKPGVALKWSEPRLEGAKNGVATVIISGQTEPGAEIRISPNKIIVVNPLTKKFKILDPQKVLGIAEPIVVGKNGQFEIPLSLPYLQVQLPITVEVPEQKLPPQPFVFVFSVTPQKVVVGEEESAADKGERQEPPADLGAKKNARYLASLGFTHSQIHQGYSRDFPISLIEYQSTNLPFVYLAHDQFLRDSLSLRVDLSYQPGRANTSEYVLVSSGRSFALQTLGVHGTYWTKRGFNYTGTLEYQRLPFYERTTINGVKLTYVGAPLLEAAAGYTGSFATYDWEAFLRLGMPIGADPGHEFSSSLVAMVEAGVAHEFSNLRLGVYWSLRRFSGQIKSKDSLLQTKITTDYSLMNNNLEVRLAYSFH